MTGRSFWFSLSGILFLFLLIGREWLVHESIDSVKEQMKSDLSQQIRTVSTIEKLHRFQESSLAFERFIEPVLFECNRLLWPASRSEEISSWKRELHAELEKRIQEEEIRLNTVLTKELDMVRGGKTASVARLYDVLEKRESFAGESQACRTTVQEEMKLIKEAGIKKDDETLAAIKMEGNARLNALRAQMKKMGRRDLGEYLASGRFVKEIQQPVLELILQVKDTEVRASAWFQFRDKLSDALNKKQGNLNRSDDAQREKIQKLFDPLAEVNTEREALSQSPDIGPLPRQQIPEVIRRPDDPITYEPEPENPAASESPSTILE